MVQSGSPAAIGRLAGRDLRYTIQDAGCKVNELKMFEIMCRELMFVEHALCRLSVSIAARE